MNFLLSRATYITRLSFSTSTVRANYAHVLVNERCTTESVPVLLCGPSERLLNSAIIQNSNIFDCLPMVHAGFLLKSGYLTTSAVHVRRAVVRRRGRCCLDPCNKLS